MKIKNIWWLLLLKGVLFVLFGFIAISWTGKALAILAFIFALLILSSGIINLISGITNMGHAYKSWFLTVMIGIFEISVGIYALNNPGMSLATLILLIGFTLIIRGIFEVISAFDGVYENYNKTLLAIGGTLGILAGAIILRYPIAGSLAFVWVLGLYAIIIGSIYIALSMITKRTIDDIAKSIREK